MKRERDSGIQGIAMKVAGALAVVGTGLLAVTQWSSIRRYLRIKRISARQHAVPSMPQDTGAHAPRWGSTHWPINR